MLTKGRAGAALGFLAVGVVFAITYGHDSATQSADRTYRPKVEIIDAAWSSATGQRYFDLVKQGQASAVPALPELRLYDQSHRLLFKATGATPGNTAERLDAALHSAQELTGPSFAGTIGEIETRNHQPVSSHLRASRPITVFEYWAEWCAPCKVIEKELLAWASRQPSGSVRIVKVEADIVKVMKAQGASVVVEKAATPGPDVR